MRPSLWRKAVSNIELTMNFTILVECQQLHNLSFDKLAHLRTPGICQLKLFPPSPALGPWNSKCEPVTNMATVERKMHFVNARILSAVRCSLNGYAVP